MIRARKAVLEMEEYNPPLSERSNFMRLDFNENTIGCSPMVLAALRYLKPSCFAAYPEYASLRMRLANYCKIDIDEIIATNGTDEAIKAIIEAYMEKGKDEIIVPVPTYAMFRFYAQLNEAILKEVPYNDDLSFPTERILKEISNKTKIVVLVNPNNPTGTSIKEKDIIIIIKKAKRCNAIVLIDEAYYEFCGKTSIQLIKKYENLFVTRTFSKAFGLAGVRLGCIVSNNKNIMAVKKVLSPYSVNNLAIACVLAALNDPDYTKRYVKEVKQSKAMLYKALDRLGIPYYKSDANFVLARIGPKCRYLCGKLREKGILIRDRSRDLLLEGCVRITLGTIKQTIKLVSALNSVIKEINPLLIFDIDGVLADVSKSYRLAVKLTSEYFTESNVLLKKIQYYKNKGGFNNDWELTEKIIKSKGLKISKKKVIEKFQEFYGKLKDNEEWLLDKRILRILSRKYNLAILTGRPAAEAYYVLKQNDARRYFKSVVAMQDTLKQKPNPEGLLKLLKNFKTDYGYYFGDTVDDTKAAVSARIIPVGVLPPQDKSLKLRNMLKANGAKFVLKDINEIIEVLP